MKFLITSTGFSNEELIIAAEKALGKNRQEISVAIINEAYTVEKGDKAWVINEMYQVSKIFSKFIDLVDLLGLGHSDVKKRLENVDMIYLVGGDTEYLMKVVYDAGLDEYFAQNPNKLIVGSSSGGMILCTRPNPKVYWEIYGETIDYKFEKYLNYLPDTIIPHFQENNFPDLDEVKLKNISEKYNFKLAGMNNSQGILCVDGRVEFINGEPTYFG